MRALNKKLEFTAKEYYSTHLSIINSLINVKLTPKEIEVLASFMALTGDIAKDRFGATAKKLIKSELKISDAGLSNYVKSLKQKGFITSNNKIPNVLIPNENKQEYYLQIINTDYEK